MFPRRISFGHDRKASLTDERQIGVVVSCGTVIFLPPPMDELVQRVLPDHPRRHDRAVGRAVEVASVAVGPGLARAAGGPVAGVGVGDDEFDRVAHGDVGRGKGRGRARRIVGLVGGQGQSTALHLR